MIAEAEVAIDAPIERVWQVMTDVARYPEWNPFVVELAPIGGGFEVGRAIRLTVRWSRGGGARTVEVVTRLDAPAPSSPGRRAIMEYRYTGWLPRLGLVRGSRLQVLEQPDGGPTVYRTAERFSGLLKRAVPLGRVQDGFERHAQALKRRAEALRSTTSTGTSPR